MAADILYIIYLVMIKWLLLTNRSVYIYTCLLLTFPVNCRQLFKYFV